MLQRFGKISFQDYSYVWLWGLFLDFMDNLQNYVYRVLIKTAPDFPEYLPLF